MKRNKRGVEINLNDPGPYTGGSIYPMKKDNGTILQSSITIVEGKADLDYTFPDYKIKDWKKWILGNNFCPKCGARIYLNCIGGYPDNPWGYWLRCEEMLFGRCDYDQYFDNPAYDESKARYSEDGERLG